jgi:NAD(P)-dependent dehydrogenase (short-subunit alcohol dehydrogenase family)
MSYPGSRPLAVVTGASSGIGYELACVFGGLVGQVPARRECGPPA